MTEREKKSDSTGCHVPVLFAGWRAGLASVSLCAFCAAPWPCIVHLYASYARLGKELAIDKFWPREKRYGAGEKAPAQR